MNPGGAVSFAGFGPLTAIAVALVALAGALAIHWLRGPKPPAGAATPSRARLPAQEPAKPPLPRPPGLPDWSVADGRLLAEPQLLQKLREYANRAGIPHHVLPNMCQPDGRDGEFVHRGKFAYEFSAWDRGYMIDDYTSSVVDQFLFHILRSRAYMRAYLESIALDLPEPERSAWIVAEQHRMLAAIDPSWARQAEYERALAFRPETPRAG